MTTAEMLADVSAQIRKDIPRLMELREGCMLDYFINERAYTGKVVETFTSYFNVYFDGEIKSIDFELDENTFKIIGHDIMLNDVLEWIKFNAFNVEFQENGDFNLHRELKLSKSIERYNFVNWDLSKPLLKDQVEELIKFLYALIKQQKWNN